MHLSGYAELRSTPARFCVQPGQRPVTSRLARIRATAGGSVTHLRHETVALQEPSRRLLPHLDGSNDRAALAAIMAGSTEKKIEAVSAEIAPDLPGKHLELPLGDSIEQTLAWLACAALISG
jgi:hypothetical protein